MSRDNSTRQRPQSKPSSTPAITPGEKPAKPRPDFPLFAHAKGYWAKKIRGQLVYFGRWEDPDGALAKYLAQKDELHTGRKPDVEKTLTVYLLCAKFLTAKKDLVESGELSHHTLTEYAATCKRLIKRMGRNRLVATIGPADFERYRAVIAKGWGFYRIANEVTRVRTIFRYADDSDLIDKPVHFGQSFRRPSRKVIRSHRNTQGPKMFEPGEIKRMLAAAGQPLKAMILLGINCGFGNSDVGTLPMSALDLEGAWLSYPRPKTGIARKCPLWKETIEALREWLTIRPDHDSDIVFVTKYGGTFARTEGQATPKSSWADSPLSKQMRKLLDKLGINGHRNFYALRHSFQTVGDDSRDFIAVRKIMGHAMDEDIADVYREKISDDRLRAVAEHVRGWLFAPTSGGKRQRRPQTKGRTDLKVYAG
jgi:integrase